ncbi:MAG: hypothetical protein JJ957_03140 [Pseudomonadales bacterium]|nr:hypothetical protein [Pseudomonadales bacterium]MBO6594809.1 hypothetical protein [Pseudomonadales bacterium]MBO6821631.1 hypothetical protein [Pseudomonadales bacterium]
MNNEGDNMQYNRVEIGARFTFTEALEAPIMKKVSQSSYQDLSGRSYVVRSEYMDVYPLRRMAT